MLELVTTSSDGAATLQFYLHRMVGQQNAVAGVKRVFEMLQYEKLNRILILSLLEVIVKLVFAEDRRQIK
jgi:hypothetical protein